MFVSLNDLKWYIERYYGIPRILYLNLYTKRVRLLVYSDGYLEHIRNQIPYIVCDNIDDEYDATIFLWEEKNECAPNVINECDTETQTYFYGLKSLKYDDVIKQGHFLVNIFYKILKTNNTSLVHGAVVGTNNNGVLLCARGQRGKSTLTVLSMLNGMEYVSDDYLHLEIDKENNVYASPIYSIITLSPFIADQLSAKLKGTIKLGNNARGDKYVYNIGNMHNSFKKHYPISCLMFPEIVDDEFPFIRKATSLEKGRAITHLLHSTTSQMQDTKDVNVTKKLIHMVNQFECYYFGLSRNIELNSEYFKNFLEKGSFKNEI